ncbi:MAG: YhfC family glutamic-type intramembrane protease [Thermoguttaceae bacterium]|jgi:uncharacterized membrane protein YhfC
MTELRWDLVAGFALSILTNMALPFVVATFLARRYKARWRWWFLGVGVFLVFQVLTRIPVMVVIQRLPAVKEWLAEPVPFWSFLAIAAFTAGLFEEGGRWLALRFIVPPAERRLSTGLMLGAGHGGLEVLGVGLLQLIALISYVALTLMPADSIAAAGPQVAQAKAQYAGLHGWEPLLGAWERVCAMAIQIGLSVMVLNAFRRGPRWWWLALLTHTLVDFTSVAALKVGANYLGPLRAGIATEGLVTVYAVIALGFLRSQRGAPETPPNGFGESAPDIVEPATEGDTLAAP